ncbi:hypothetical protein KNE206_25100 [Kitasatospora sp. NE20-6]|uniref:hypothetical protein n=1 Tax=Kitasatospora sp. NE20-6 TaxID=2859066 RepID=UPI0034DC1591
MKLSKRAAGALLLAVGAGVLAGQGAAEARPMTPGEVAALEDGLAGQEVPFNVPLPLLTQTGTLSGGLPASPLQPPVPEENPGSQLIPSRIVPALNAGRVGPAVDAVVPLPAADSSTELGQAVLAVPAAPIRTSGPALELGQPVRYATDHSGEFADGALSFGELDPQLVTAPVQAVPGAKASLGGDDQKVSVTDTVGNLTAAATGALSEDVLAQPAV